MTPGRFIAATALVAVAACTSACGGIPVFGSGDSAEVVVVDDTAGSPAAGAANGGAGESPSPVSGEQAGEAVPAAGPVPGVVLPVTFRYRGANWTLTELVREVEDAGGYANAWYRAELRVENPGVESIAVSASDLRLRTAAGVDLTATSDVSMGANQTIEATIEFPVPETDPEPTGLQFAVVEPDLIPEIVPLTAAAPAASYPLEPGFSGTTGLVLGYAYGSFTTTALGARIDINGDGTRAKEGKRLVTLQVRGETPADNPTGGLTWPADQYRMVADGVSLKALTTPTYQTMTPGSTLEGEFVFEVPADATTLELRVSGYDGEAFQSLPLDFGGTLPAYGQE